MSWRKYCRYFKMVWQERNSEGRESWDARDINATRAISLSEFPIAGGAGMMWPRGCGSGQLPHVCVKWSSPSRVLPHKCVCQVVNPPLHVVWLTFVAPGASGHVETSLGLGKVSLQCLLLRFQRQHLLSVRPQLWYISSTWPPLIPFYILLRPVFNLHLGWATRMLSLRLRSGL